MDKTMLTILADVIKRNAEELNETPVYGFPTQRDCIEAMKIAMKQGFGVGINFFNDAIHQVSQSEIDLFFLEYINKLENLNN